MKVKEAVKHLLQQDQEADFYVQQMGETMDGDMYFQSQTITCGTIFNEDTERYEDAAIVKIT